MARPSGRLGRLGRFDRFGCGALDRPDRLDRLDQADYAADLRVSDGPDRRPAGLGASAVKWWSKVVK